MQDICQDGRASVAPKLCRLKVPESGFSSQNYACGGAGYVAVDSRYR